MDADSVFSLCLRYLPDEKIFFLGRCQFLFHPGKIFLVNDEDHKTVFPDLEKKYWVKNVEEISVV